MSLLKKFLDNINGLRYRQEYLCLSKESFQDPLHIYLAEAGIIRQDISSTHVFAGYHPLVFIIPTTGQIMDAPTPTSRLIFSQNPLSLNEVYREKDAVAWLDMKWQRELATGHSVWLGLKGMHRFLSKWHQAVIGLENSLFRNKPGNIYLKGNLLKQVQIAYAFPRIISLVTLHSGNNYNVFPTDLNGAIGNNHYLISLRKNGKACQQVELTRRLKIFQVDSSAYALTYSQGRNHMQDLKPREEWVKSGIFSDSDTANNPIGSIRYRELELINSWDMGIHRLLFFEASPQIDLRTIPDTLSHIHQAYATWRWNKGLAGNYLLR